jgi:hypothetical protein
MAFMNLSKFIEEFGEIALAIVFAGLIIVYGSELIGDQKTEIEAQSGNESAAAQAAADVESGILDLSGSMTQVVGVMVVVVILVVLGLLRRING